jgi:hypothetical protein
MTLSLYDLPHKHRELIHIIFDAAKERFADIATDFSLWLNPDNSEHILLNVNVPFYDNDREIAFRDYTAELSSDLYEKSDILISLMPHYVPAMQSAEEHEPA